MRPAPRFRLCAIPPSQRSPKAGGIGAGINLQKLAEIAGRPVTFSMCGCDFGGRVFEGAPDGLSMVLDWPAEAEASLGVVPRHEDDYRVTTSELAHATTAKFTVSVIRVNLPAAP